MSPSSAWPSSVLRWSKPLVGQPVKCPTARKAICSGTWKWVKYAQSVAKKIYFLGARTTLRWVLRSKDPKPLFSQGTYDHNDLSLSSFKHEKVRHTCFRQARFLFTTIASPG